MAECHMIASLVKFVPVPHDVLLMAALRLLHNLSFDVDMREDMVKNGLIPKVAQTSHYLLQVPCTVLFLSDHQA